MEEPELASSLSSHDLGQRLSEWGSLREAQLQRRAEPGHFSAQYAKRPT